MLSNKSGFTLLELMIVLVVISLLLGLSSVYFSGQMPGYRFRATARDLSATMRFAQLQAVMNGSKQTLTIDMDAKRYGIEGREIKNIDPAIAIKVLDPFSGEISRGAYHFVFSPAGAAQGGAIVLASGKKTVRIELDPVVGSVVIR